MTELESGSGEPAGDCFTSSPPLIKAKFKLAWSNSIPGWCQYGAVKLANACNTMQQEFSVTGGVAEIGVHHGRFFLPLSSLRRPGEIALAVDLFPGKDQQVAFRRNLRGHKRVVTLVTDSTGLHAAEYVRAAKGPLRLFSVDGGHEPAIARHDLHEAAAALASGGLLIVDDVFNQQWPGVAEAFFEFVGTDWLAVATGWNKVIVCRAAEHERYYARLRELLPLPSRARRFLGGWAICYR